MSSRWQEGDHSNEDAATTFHCPGTEDRPRWWPITTTAHLVWRLPLPARICSRPWPNHGHAHMELVTRFSPSQYHPILARLDCHAWLSVRRPERRL